ncbi:hypothetical protein [Paraburkholderia nemoris]|uniref:hypothetical protein n=1 Tax=Paraburkholderia nemoris TaxID=2793076 RepID=UPI001B01BA33|nr:hypothetical protein [Paraburkholderia nemoris]CAE6838679.1 hypothetical protein R75777_06960 [Paraburkholderia nemoris]
MDAIFESTEQALHVSFLILSVPAMGENKFRQFLMQVLEQAPSLSKRQQLWLEQLKGQKSDTVNFGGLNQLEVRGQCAMIVAAVRDRLPSTERGALLSRFGVGDDKQSGIVRLALHARRSCGLGLRPCAKLTARHYLPKSERDALSFRDLADEFKVTKDKLFRASIWMAKQYRAMENLGIARLDAKFKAQGVVETEEFVADEASAKHADVANRREADLAYD